MRVLPLCALTAALAALWGCATVPAPTYDPTASTALNVVRMAGLEGVADIPSHSPAMKGGAGVADYGFAASAPLSAPPGFSPGASAGMGLLSVLTTSSPRAHPASLRHIYAWVPADLAASPAETQAKVVELVTQSFLDAFDPKHEMVLREGTFSPALAPAMKFPVWTRQGCPPLDDGHRKSFAPECSGALTIRLTPSPRGSLDDVGAAPPFLASLKVARGPVEIHVRPTGMFADWWSAPESLAALSSAMPLWIYIYQPPTSSAPATVLNQGRSMSFSRHP